MHATNGGDTATAVVAIPRRDTAKTLAGYLARPEGTGPRPGVIVLHEIFGLNENIRGIARRFAQAGYAALALDLFSPGHRAVCLLRLLSGLLLRPLHNGVVADVQGARHSFFNEHSRNYHPEAAADAWARTLAFFAEHSGAAPPPRPGAAG